MKKCENRLFWYCLAAGLLILLSSCARSGPSRFYLLNTLDSEPETSTGAGKAPLRIGIGQIYIPDYLDRSDIVVRKSQNRLELAEFDKWAGSLKHDLPRVLAENLSRLLQTDHVYLFPWSSAVSVDYLISADFFRLDTDDGGNTVLKARWAIFEKDGKELRITKNSLIRKTAASAEVEAYIHAQSLAIGELSLEMARAVREIRNK
jgi:uncharacterized lipoprotein YmbA